MVVNAYERATEGQYFTKGNEERVVDFTHGRGEKPSGEQRAPKGAHGCGDYELELFHFKCVIISPCPAGRNLINLICHSLPPFTRTP